MGLFSSKKKQSTNTTTATNSNSSTTATPNVPDWLATPFKTSAGQVGQLQAQGPATYAPQMTDLEKQAFGGAANLTTSPNFQTATNAVNGINYSPTPILPQQATAGTVQSASLLDGLENYYNPYEDQILNPVLDDYDVNAGKTRAAQAAKEAATGAFRGSRAGVAEAGTEGELARGRAATEGGLLQDMFNTATSLSNSDAARRQDASTTNAQLGTQISDSNASRDLSAKTSTASNNLTANGQRLQGAGLLSDIGTAQGTDARANVGAQLGAGAAQQQILDSIRQYPLEYQEQIQGLLAGLDPSLFTGKTVDGTESATGTSNSTTTTSGSPMDTIGKIAQIAALFA